MRLGPLLLAAGATSILCHTHGVALVVLRVGGVVLVFVTGVHELGGDIVLVLWYRLLKFKLDSELTLIGQFCNMGLILDRWEEQTILWQLSVDITSWMLWRVYDQPLLVRVQVYLDDDLTLDCAVVDY